MTDHPADELTLPLEALEICGVTSDSFRMKTRLGRMLSLPSAQKMVVTVEDARPAIATDAAGSAPGAPIG